MIGLGEIEDECEVTENSISNRVHGWLWLVVGREALKRLGEGGMQGGGVNCC